MNKNLQHTADAGPLHVLLKRHPEAEPMLRAFAPLLAAQDRLARNEGGICPVPVALPALDALAFAQGKPWLPVGTGGAMVGTASNAAPGAMSETMPGANFLNAASLDAAFPDANFLDTAFLAVAPGLLAQAAAEGFPARAQEIKALGAWLADNPAACWELAALRLDNRLDKCANWAAQHGPGSGFDANLAALFSAQLAGAAARRVALCEPNTNAGAMSATSRNGEDTTAPHRERWDSGWEYGYCPVCGSLPHASALKSKNGKRTLQCSLCRHEWHFARVACPVCRNTSADSLPHFYLEEFPDERAEACTACNSYILGADMREYLEQPPLELLLLCLAPLEALVADKGFKALTSARNG